MPVIFVFSCVIYWLAIRSRLLKEEMESHIEQSRRESEEEEHELQSA